MLLPHGLLVLVLDGSRMQLLRNEGTSAKPQLELLASDHVEHPATHLLGTDRPGRSFGSAGTSRHAYTETDLHERQEAQFALAALNRLVALSEESGVIFVAPPRVLGQLRQEASRSLGGRVVASFDHDLAHRRPQEICAFLVDQEV